MVLTKKRVLIVDDAKLMRIVIKNIVEKDPAFDIVGSCENGQEALDMLRRDPDIILVDIEMPVMDGLTFIKHARPKTQARIIVLSSISGLGSETAKAARQLGADAVLQKPSGSVSIDLAEKRGGEILQTMRRLAAVA